MEDFDEAEEQNEEDLMELKDSFADIPNLRVSFMFNLIRISSQILSTTL